MGLFTKPGSHIDRSTGRNKRDKVTQRATHGGPPRQQGTGKVTGRAQWRREQKTGWASPAKHAASKSHWW